MVSSLDSGESGPGLSPGQAHCVVFLGKTLHSHGVSLHPGRYKWVPANLMLGVTLRWTSIPSRGEQEYSQSIHATKTRMNSGLIGHLARMQTLPLPTLRVRYLIPIFRNFRPTWRGTTKMKFRKIIASPFALPRIFGRMESAHGSFYAPVT